MAGDKIQPFFLQKKDPMDFHRVFLKFIQTMQTGNKP